MYDLNVCKYIYLPVLDSTAIFEYSASRISDAMWMSVLQAWWSHTRWRPGSDQASRDAGSGQCSSVAGSGQQQTWLTRTVFLFATRHTDVTDLCTENYFLFVCVHYSLPTSSLLSPPSLKSGIRSSLLSARRKWKRHTRKPCSPWQHLTALVNSVFCIAIMM